MEKIQQNARSSTQISARKLCICTTIGNMEAITGDIMEKIKRKAGYNYALLKIERAYLQHKPNIVQHFYKRRIKQWLQPPRNRGGWGGRLPPLAARLPLYTYSHNATPKNVTYPTSQKIHACQIMSLDRSVFLI